MKLTKAVFYFHYTTSSTLKRLNCLSSNPFCSFREPFLKANEETAGNFQRKFPNDSVEVQTIQFFSKEIAKSEKKNERVMDLKNDPRDFEVYYFQEDWLAYKSKKKRASNKKQRRGINK